MSARFVDAAERDYKLEAEQRLIVLRKEALAEMQSEASQMGANAVIGVDIDYEVLGQNGSMLMVSASGTAVSV